MSETQDRVMESKTIDEVIDELKIQATGVRLECRTWNTRKAIRPEQQQKVNDTFKAASQSTSTRKRIIDPTEESYRKANGIVTNYWHYWRSMTIPYPIQGVRLIRQEKIQQFREESEDFVSQLKEAADELQSSLAAIVAKNRMDLGDLFDSSDYPQDVAGLYSVNYDIVSITPPSILKDIDEDAYNEQVARVQSRLQKSVDMMEQELAQKMQQFCKGLITSLGNKEDGKPKALRAATVDNLKEFFKYFKEVNLSSSDALNSVVTDAEGLLDGRTMDTLRKDTMARGEISEQFEEINEKLEEMLKSTSSRKMEVID